MERTIWGDKAVGHAGSVEGSGWMALAIEKNQAPGSVTAKRELANASVGDRLGDGVRATRFTMGWESTRIAEKVDGHFRHNDFHDAFAVTGARDAAGSNVCITAAADERRIADTTGKFTAGASRGCSGEERTARVESDSADRAGFMADVMFGSVGILATTGPGKALAIDDQLGGIAERNSIFGSKLFGASVHEHHVRGFFLHGAGQANGIANALDGGDSTRFQGRAIHEDGVKLDAAIASEMRAIAGVERGVVFEEGDGGFDSVGSGPAGSEDAPAFFESAGDASATVFDGFSGNVPGATMNDERRSQRERLPLRRGKSTRK